MHGAVDVVLLGGVVVAGEVGPVVTAEELHLGVVDVLEGVGDLVRAGRGGRSELLLSHVHALESVVVVVVVEGLVCLDELLVHQGDSDEALEHLIAGIDGLLASTVEETSRELSGEVLRVVIEEVTVLDVTDGSSDVLDVGDELRLVVEVLSDVVEHLLFSI